MPELPSGTVTFLFSDIEGSTNLLRELGDDYAAALAAHRDVLRAAFAEHCGVEVDTQGDAFFAAFARASDAVAAAEEIQRELAPGPIRVRIGVHTGEPQITDEGYVGLDVHRGARVCAAGHGGQVLLSQTDARARRRGGLRSRRAPSQGPPRAAAALPARKRGVPAAQDARLDEPARCRRPRSSAASANWPRPARCSANSGS